MSRSNRPPALLFQRLLDRAPFTDREIGRAIGRSHTTVHRWRTGVSAASWGDMERVTTLIERRNEELANLLARLREPLGNYRISIFLMAGLAPDEDGGP